MSYEPRIIIRKSDLVKNTDKITNGIYSDNKKTFEELYNALNSKIISFPEIDIVIIRPELTSHNNDVRNLLDELEIDYRLDN